MRYNCYIFRTFLMLLTACCCLNVSAKKKKKDKEETIPEKSAYEKLTGRDSVAMEGVMNVIAKGDTFYLELPTRLLGRTFLVTNRLKRVPKELNEAGVNTGINYENQCIRFEWDRAAKKIRIRQQRTKPSVNTEDAIAISVEENYIDPLLFTMDVKETAPDSSTVIFQVNKLFDGSENCLNDVFNNINIGQSPNTSLSRILSIKSHPTNVSATSEMTTVVHEGMEKVSVSVEVGCNLLLLPEIPMKPREESNRVGYFAEDRLHYADNQAKVETRHEINRWRLEPSDIEAYMKGELTEPVQPITFYLDNRIPSSIKPYIRTGILDWNKAFEKAGFRNAIQVVEMTDSMKAEDDDLRYSVLTYAASEKENAMGPSLIDPRSGEILEADIIWWHNVRKLLAQWITVQTGAICPEARQPQLPEKLLGDAARFVATHEVGHSLGLRHNMRASNAYPTDSLRSVTFTDRMGGTSASIMDYARFNYVAQPGDGVRVLSPHLGPYDFFAIEWGYRWFPDEETEKRELAKLLSTHTDPVYRYSETVGFRQAYDPRAMSEDLGDDPLKSAKYGIENLKRIVPHIEEWTTTGEEGQGWSDAAHLWEAIINQWDLFNYHVLACVGGIYLENTTVGDGQQTYTYVERQRQKGAVQYLIDEVLHTPAWLFQIPLVQKTYLIRNGQEEHPMMALRNEQNYILWDLLDNERLVRMLQQEFDLKEKAFRASELMSMLHEQLITAIPQPDVMQRSMQKGLVDALITASAAPEGIKVNKSFCHEDDHELSSKPRKVVFTGKQITRVSDAISLKRAELMRIRRWAKSHVGDGTTEVQMHYADLIQRIDNAMEMR